MEIIIIFYESQIVNTDGLWMAKEIVSEFITIQKRGQKQNQPAHLLTLNWRL